MAQILQSSFESENIETANAKKVISTILNADKNKNSDFFKHYPYWQKSTSVLPQPVSHQKESSVLEETL
jgi:hypothetical protein